MKPRGLKDKIVINESTHIIDPVKSLENITDSNSFDYGKIVTYCPYCNTKHDLEYSGYFPKQIGYKCNKCEETITILDTGYKNFDISFVAEAIQKTVQDRESFALGYNYALYNDKSNVRDFSDGVKKYVSGRLYHQISLTLFLLLSIITVNGILLLLIVQILPILILVLCSLCAIVMLSITDNIIERHRKSKVDLKDSVMSYDNMSPVWISEGIEKIYPELTMEKSRN